MMLQQSAMGDIVGRETREVPDERDNLDQRDRPEYVAPLGNILNFTCHL